MTNKPRPVQATLDYCSPPNDREKVALAYAHRGWSVLPIKPRGKTPLLDTWQQNQHTIATDYEIHEWFRQWPDANIGIITGRVSGLVVLDVDGDVGRASITGKAIPVSPQ